MCSRLRHKNMAAHGPASNQQPLVDGWTTSDSASDAGDHQQNSMAHCSLISAAGNMVASKVELHPQANPDPLTEMVTLIREQATRIHKLERNMDRMRDVDRRRCRECHHRHQKSPKHDGGRSLRECSCSAEHRHRENSQHQSIANHREPWEERAGQYHEHSESWSPLGYADQHSRRGLEHYKDPDDGDDTPFSDYIMETQPPKGFKPLSDMEPYDESSDPQEYMDAFKSRMVLAGASDPVKCRPFPITLKKVVLKWFNSLAPRSINQFSDLSSLFLAHFTTKKFKPKPISSLLELHQRHDELLRDFLE